MYACCQAADVIAMKHSENMIRNLKITPNVPVVLCTSSCK